jgi:hypothetical protein
MRLCVEGIWRISQDTFAIVIYTGHSFMFRTIFDRFVPSDMRIICISESTTLGSDLKSTSKSSSSEISSYMYLPPPICSVRFGIEAIWWGIAVTVILRGATPMLGKGWLLHQLSDGFDNVATPVCYRV